MFFEEDPAEDQQRYVPLAGDEPEKYKPEQPWLYQMVDHINKASDKPPYEETFYTWRELRRGLREIITTLYERHHQPVSAQTILAELRRTKGTPYVEVDFKLLVLLLNCVGGCVVSQQSPPC